MLKHKLFKNTFIYMFAEIINKAVPFLLLPILTTYLTPKDYGIVATYTAYISILAVFVQLSMPGAVNVNFFKLSKENLKIYIINVFLILFSTAFIILSIIYLFQDELSTKFDIKPLWLLLGGIVVFAQSFTLINLVLWQAEQNPKSYAIYQLSFMLINTLFVLLFVVYYKLGWEGQLIGQTLAVFIFFILSLLFIFKRGYLGFSMNLDYVKDALKFGVPLIPHTLSGWFKTGVDRIFITSFVGTTATGIYALGYQLGMILGILAIAFNQAFSPWLYKKLTNITEESKYILVKYTYLYFLSILLLAWFISYIMPWFIINFIDIKYVSSIELIPWIVFGYAFQGMYFMVVNYIFFMKKTVPLAITTFICGVLHALLSYFLIKNYASLGAAYATTISYFLTFVAVWILSYKTYPMPWSLGFIKKIRSIN